MRCGGVLGVLLVAVAVVMVMQMEMGLGVRRVQRPAQCRIWAWGWGWDWVMGRMIGVRGMGLTCLRVFFLGRGGRGVGSRVSVKRCIIIVLVRLDEVR